MASLKKERWKNRVRVRVSQLCPSPTLMAGGIGGSGSSQYEIVGRSGRRGGGANERIR